MPFYQSLAALLVATTLMGSVKARAGEAPKPNEEDLRTQLSEMRVMLMQSNQRLEALETKLGSLGDKVTATQNGLDIYLSNTHAAPTAVHAHPSEGVGSHPNVVEAPHDPEGGFVNDEAAQDYRKASILLEAQKYSDSVLAFASFLEKYPDHPLAGSAQYYLGEAYFRQKEYKLSLREFERVLTSYDRSPHIADTLHEMAEAEDHLKLTDKAARHRQLLTSLFPQSPAADFGAPAAAHAESSEHPVHSEAPTHAPVAVQPASGLDAPPTAPLTEGVKE
jgi:tol-pal system protein YbgF